PDRRVGAATAVNGSLWFSLFLGLFDRETSQKRPPWRGGRALPGPLRGVSGQRGMTFRRGKAESRAFLSIYRTMKAGTTAPSPHAGQGQEPVLQIGLLGLDVADRDPRRAHRLQHLLRRGLAAVIAQHQRPVGAGAHLQTRRFGQAL